MEEVTELFARIGESLDADALETILAAAGMCEGSSNAVQDLSQSMEELSTKFAGLSEDEKVGMARRALEALPAEPAFQAARRGCADESYRDQGYERRCDVYQRTLVELCPGIPEAFLEHVLRREVGDVEAAAIWLTGREGLQREADRWVAAQQAAAQRQADAQRAERASRKALLDRFAFQPVAAAAPAARPRHPKGGPRAAEPAPAPAAKVRYRDGMPVASKGEKFIVQAVKPEWDGGSQGKVFTKGKRGKGVA